MENSLQSEEQAQLNRLLYRATDYLTEFELSLLQLQVSNKQQPIMVLYPLVCAACGKPWPHSIGMLNDQVGRLSKHTVSKKKAE